MSTSTSPHLPPAPLLAQPPGRHTVGRWVRRETNAAVAIALRDVTSAVRKPAAIAFTVIFPVIFLGLLGTTLQQNIGEHLGFDLLRFMFVGMLASTIYQSAMNGMISLVEDRKEDFTQEMFVSPVARGTIMLGKGLGSSLVSLTGLIGLFAVAAVLRVTLHPSDIGHVLLLAPLICLGGVSLGTLMIGFVHDPKVAGFAGFLLVFPQMFLSGALIPVGDSHGVLAALVHALPMTYLIDLERHVFYPGDAAMVQRPVLVDLVATAGFCAAFLVIGTVLFTRSERNR